MFAGANYIPAALLHECRDVQVIAGGARICLRVDVVREAYLHRLEYLVFKNKVAEDITKLGIDLFEHTLVECGVTVFS
jgi:hypothetical protein